MDLSALKPLLLLLCVCGLSVATDVLQPGPVDALAGGTATFKTLMKNPEFTVIVWNFNDGKDLNPISTRFPDRENVDAKYTDRATIDRNGTLTLSGLTEADSGEYTISVIGAQTLSGEINLRVIVPVADVAIKSNVPEALELNTTVALTCSSKGSFLDFKWLNNTTPITADGTRVTLAQDADPKVSTLTFSSVYRTDLVGPIYCSVSNALSSGKSPAFNLTVHYGPELVTISPASPPAFLASKSDFSLTCTASSSPAAAFNWFHNNTALETAGPVLTLKDIEKEGVGKTTTSYTCRAKNAKTEKTVSSAPVTFTIIEKIVGVKLTGPSGKLFAGNTSANLSCEAEKGSMPTVKWLKNGAALSAGGRVVIAADGKSVMINPLQKDDNAEFTCEMSNPVGKETAKVKLTVFYGPEAVQLTGDTEVEIKDEVELKCSAESVPPANYTWKLNGTKLPVTTGHYVIPKAVFENAGTYTCEAYNAVTGKTSSKSQDLKVVGEGELDPALSDGAIAGIVIGVLAAVALAIGLFIYCRQKVPLESPY